MRSFVLVPLVVTTISVLVWTTWSGARSTIEQAGGSKSRVDRPLLWEAARGPDTLHLFGSIHLAPPDIHPLPQEVGEALARARSLVVEADIRNPPAADALGDLLARGILPPDSSLNQILSPSELEILDTLLSRAGQPRSAVQRFRPWMAALQLVTASGVAHGIKPQYGVDLRLLQDADSRGLPVMELEGVLAQLTLFADLPMALQRALFRQRAGESADLGRAFDSIVDPWRRGDSLALERAARNDDALDLDLRALDELLVVRRNRTMARKLDSLTTRYDGSWLVVVGAGHLVGAYSIPRILLEHGWQVRILETSGP